MVPNHAIIATRRVNISRLFRAFVLSNVYRFDTACGFEEYNQVTWINNGTRCGYCGDKYISSQPRAHELGGKFGKGVITRKYIQGSVVEVTVHVSGNHHGFFYFKICNLDEESESEECFNRHKLYIATGLEIYPLLTNSPGDFRVPLILPGDLICDHCVLQWTYVAGNSRGICPDGRERQGCGRQEHWRSCSDIKILQFKFSDNNYLS